MNAVPPQPYPSLAALQVGHLDLIEASDALDADPAAEAEAPTIARRREVALLRRRIRSFVGRAIATGALLDLRAERELAQSIADNWCVRDAYLLREADRLRGSAGDPSRLPRPRRIAPLDTEAAPELAESAAPFIGLSAFAEGQTAIFHGREEAARSLVRNMDSRLIVVSGPSGSGKSSLVMAGAMPLLRHGAAPGSESWTYWPAVLPGADPIAALLLSIRPAGRDPAEWIAEHRAVLAADPATIVGLLAQADPQRAPSLLVVDQAEELLSLSAEEMRAPFAAAIRAIASAPETQHRVILIVRDDYVDRILAIEALSAAGGVAALRFDTPPLDSGELRRAIDGPSAAVGLKFEEGIAEDLVRSVVNDPAALPLLQFTLTQLWRRRRRNRIVWDDYRLVGRPTEALGRTAEAVFQELGAEQNKAAARDVFLALVRPDRGNEYVRNRVRREALHRLRAPALIDRALQAFVAAGLIRRTPGIDADDDRFDVMHESLLRNWPRLGDWLAGQRERDARRLTQLENASLWKSASENADYLAIGAAIDEAALFAGDDPLIAAYVDASRQEAARRQRSRLAWRGGVAAALLLLLLVGGVIGLRFLEVRSTLAETRRAQAERIAARVEAGTRQANVRLADLQVQTKRVVAEAETAGRSAERARRAAAVRAVELQRATLRYAQLTQAKTAEIAKLEQQKRTAAADVVALNGELERARAEIRSAQDQARSAERQVDSAAKVLAGRQTSPQVSGNTIVDIPPEWRDELTPRTVAIVRLARSVGRVENFHSHYSWQPSATGFVVAPGLAVVIDFGGDKPMIVPETTAIDFRENPDLNDARKFKVVKVVGCRPFVSKVEGQGDISFRLCLVRLPLKNAAGEALPPPLRVQLTVVPRLALDYAIYAVGYPQRDDRLGALAELVFKESGGGVKRISPGYVVSTFGSLSGAPQFRHSAFTTGGSAGAPIVDLKTNQIIGLNWGGANNQGIAILFSEQNFGALFNAAGLLP